MGFLGNIIGGGGPIHITLLTENIGGAGAPSSLQSCAPDHLVQRSADCDWLHITYHLYCLSPSCWHITTWRVAPAYDLSRSVGCFLGWIWVSPRHTISLQQPMKVCIQSNNL
ncbi:hypothetical protein Hanom_Chr07g00648691 [Helianthus anomalus]